jgi:hypothetical protein
MFTIKEVTKDNIEAWVTLRSRLWPPSEEDDFKQEVLEILLDTMSSAFLAFEDSVNP